MGYRLGNVKNLRYRQMQIKENSEYELFPNTENIVVLRTLLTTES